MPWRMASDFQGLDEYHAAHTDVYLAEIIVRTDAAG
jgi:hypothetical protein